MDVLIVIPARMGSKRFFGKPLANIAGIPMIKRVWDIARQVKNSDRLIVATESEELKNYVEGFGAEVMLTSDKCKTGTDRVAEVAANLDKKYDLVCSLQGDNALIHPEVIEETITTAKNNLITTPAVKLTGKRLARFLDEKKAGSTTGTTVVFDKNMNALYFSKQVLPFARDDSLTEVYQHIGLYVYRHDILEEFTKIPESKLEGIEKLEQLRALENGVPIKVALIEKDIDMHSVDRPEDVSIVEKILEEANE